jgi:UDP-glucose:(heptosyl)LPS alpha-1,3-glucosyltransferase
MKIAIIRKKYSFHGGAENFSRQLISHLAAADHEVHIFAAEWKGQNEEAGVHVHRLPVIGFNSFTRDLSFALAARRALAVHDFDIVQAHDKTLAPVDIYRAGDGCHRGWLKRRAGIVGPLKRLSIACNPYHWMILWLERRILARGLARHVLAISRMVKQEVMDLYGVPEERITTLHNGVDVERFSPAKRARGRALMAERHGIGSGETVALFMGSGFERKGVKYLLGALDHVPEPLTVLICGKGPRMEHRDPHGNKRVVYAGSVREPDLYYAGADFFVFPSVYEPFGNVNTEALASGLPVVTVRSCGAAEVIEEGVDGYVLPRAQDVEGIGRAISRLTDPARREEMSRAARRKAEGMTFERHRDEILALYARVLAGRAILTDRGSVG